MGGGVSISPNDLESNNDIIMQILNGLQASTYFLSQECTMEARLAPSYCLCNAHLHAITIYIVFTRAGHIL